MISDSHNDFLTHLKLFGPKKKYIKSLHDAAYINAAFWTTESHNIVTKLHSYRQVIDAYSNGNMLLSIEDCSFLDASNYKALLDNQVSACGLTWNYDNQYAGGAEGKSKLSSIGKKLVQKLESDGMVVDISHLNHKSIDDIFEISTKPIFCSHSNIYSLCHHSRNLTDEHIKNIYATNGYLGINLVDYFLSYSNANFDDVIKHIDYFVQKYGADNIGLGTDIFGSDHLVASDYATIERLLSNKLTVLGYSWKDIENILYKNFQNFANNNLNFDKVID